MVDYNDVPLEMLANPLITQGLVLDEFKERLSGGKPITDANNVVSFLLEAFSTLTGQAVTETCNLFPALYPKRAQSSEDLYKHMSKYDYLGLFSTPASCNISLDFDKSYLSGHAVDYNDNYKLVTIPKDSVFRIGKYYFGLYYPINIKINKQTDTYVVTHDTTSNNPLKDLVSNAIEHREYTYAGVDFVSIMLTTYQFIKTSTIEDLTANTGFIKAYSYNNKFYALRVYNWRDGSWEEIEQSLSEQIYDPSSPTVQVSVEPDTQIVKLTIPQVYFTEGLMGSKLKIELYTTQGELDADISEVSSDNISAEFVLSSTTSENTYSNILTRLSTLIMSPVSTKIVGGSDGYSFEELADRVVNDTFYGNVLITPDDLEVKFKDIGFSVNKYRDNLTERIYFCYKEMTDVAGVMIGSADIPTQITSDIVDSTSSLISHTDGSITILPSTMFKYNDAVCVPVDDIELDRINNLTSVDLVTEFEGSTYTKSPFHIRLDTTDKTPLAYCYDLTSPSINRIEFSGENINISSQLTIYSASIEHIDEGTGGYDLSLLISSTDDLSEVPDTDIVVYVSTKDIFNKDIWVVGTYEGMIDGLMKYLVHIDTNYNISDNHQIVTTNFTSGGIIGDHSIDLISTLSVLLLVDPQHITSEYAMVTDIASGIDENYTSYVPTMKQDITITFGGLVSETYNRVDISYTGLEYATWEVTEYATYSNDVYERDENGDLVYTVDGSTVVLNKLHSIGDNILDEDDEPIIIHDVGDIILDSQGNPTINKNREIIYLIDMIHVDAKLIHSEASDHKNYLSDLSDDLRTYFEAVDSVSDELIENTYLYFKPLRTIGKANFKQNDDEPIELPLEMTMSFKLYVEDYVASDNTMTDLIESTILGIIDTHVATGTISMTAIAKEVSNTMSNDINHIDILGINGDTELQTLVSVDSDVRPNLKQELFIDEDGTLSVKRGLILEYVVLS